MNEPAGQPSRPDMIASTGNAPSEGRRYAFEAPGRFARGWHVLMFSRELAVGAIKKLHYFGQDLVIYRGESGRVSVLDAYCPHLGANLGNRHSKVIGDALRCPFHGWQFDHSGRCVHIPNAKSIPEKARHALRSWPVQEKCGFIALWHSHEGCQPNWELPDIPDWGDGNWGDWAFKRSPIRTQGREIIENIADRAHFGFVHGGYVKAFENFFDGINVTQRATMVEDHEQHVRLFPDDMPGWLKTMVTGNQGREVKGDATYHGPATMYYYCESRYGEVAYKSWWLNFHVPINDRELELTSGVILAPLNDGEALPQEFVEAYPEIAHAGFAADIEIWQDKKYRADPILSDADGPITKLRRWYDQFYQPATR